MNICLTAAEAKTKSLNSLDITGFTKPGDKVWNTVVPTDAKKIIEAFPVTLTKIQAANYGASCKAKPSYGKVREEDLSVHPLYTCITIYTPMFTLYTCTYTIYTPYIHLTYDLTPYIQKAPGAANAISTATAVTTSISAFAAAVVVAAAMAR